MSGPISYAHIDALNLDPKNPRLGLRRATEMAPQDAILAKMASWSLEELATSFLESGFWVQEALIVVSEPIYGEDALVVVEGNRRLAALKQLQKAYAGHPSSKAWQDLTAQFPAPKKLFDEVPYMLMEHREEVDVFLGYRHVTGIKEWAPAEKAEYIAYLVDERGMSYPEVMRKIGSRTEAVRRNYISYKIFEQMEETEGIYTPAVQERFSVLFLSLRNSRVELFLGTDMSAEPDRARRPIPQTHLDNLRDFAKWLFGTDETLPIVKDSRQVDKFAKVLASTEAITYLRSSKKPSLDYAYQVAGGEEDDVADLMEDSAFSLEQALSTVHLHTGSERVKKAARRIVLGADRLRELFPDIDA